MRMQDQLNSGSEERAPDRRDIESTDVDWSLVHFFVFLVAGAALSVLFSLALRDFNFDPTATGTIRVGIWSLLLLLVMLFQSFLIKSFQLNLYLVVIETLGLLAFFFRSLNNLTMIGAALFLGTALLGFHKGRQDLTDHLRVRFYRFGKLVVASFITGLALFLAFFYAGSYQAAGGVSFPAFRFITSGSDTLVRNFVPRFDPAMSASNFFTELARSQFQKNPQVVRLSDPEKEQVFRSVGQELGSRLAQTTGLATEPGESTISYFYRLTNHYLGLMASSAFSYFGFLLVVLIIYGIAKSVFFIVKWPLLWVSLLIYQLLRAAGIIYIVFEPRKKEIIMVK